LQIIETCQEQNQLSLDIQRPISTTQISPQSNSLINDEKIIIPTEPKICLSRSHTLPLTLSLYSSHHTPLIPTPPSDLKDFKTASSGIIETSTCLTLLPKYPQTFTTIHKNYQSFAFVTNDLHHPS
jgi:hypothetical protein